jgi:hypothetical protein
LRLPGDGWDALKATAAEQCPVSADSSDCSALGARVPFL